MDTNTSVKKVIQYCKDHSLRYPTTLTSNKEDILLNWYIFGNVLTITVSGLYYTLSFTESINSNTYQKIIQYKKIDSFYLPAKIYQLLDVSKLINLDVV